MSELINFPNIDTLTDEQRSIILDENKASFQKAIEQTNIGFTTFSSWYNDSTRKLAYVDKQLPNIGITLANKVTEISKYFTAHGLSMYIHSPSTSPFMAKVRCSLIGNAIFSDLIKISDKALFQILELQRLYISLCEEKEKENKKLLTRIKKTIRKERKNVILFTEQEQRDLNKYADAYRKFDEEIWKYDFKEHLPKAIANQINSSGPLETIVLSIILDERVRKDLVALGLEDIYPDVLAEVFTQKDPNTGKFIQSP